MEDELNNPQPTVQYMQSTGRKVCGRGEDSPIPNKNGMRTDVVEALKHGGIAEHATTGSGIYLDLYSGISILGSELYISLSSCQRKITSIHLTKAGIKTSYEIGFSLRGSLWFINFSENARKNLGYVEGELF